MSEKEQTPYKPPSSLIKLCDAAFDLADAKVDLFRFARNIERRRGQNPELLKAFQLALDEFKIIRDLLRMVESFRDDEEKRMTVGYMKFQLLCHLKNKKAIAESHYDASTKALIEANSPSLYDAGRLQMITEVLEYVESMLDGIEEDRGEYKDWIFGDE